MINKTDRIIQEVRDYVAKNPQSTVYTNDKSFQKRLQKEFPQTRVAVLTSFPEKSYPNLFCVDSMKNFKKAEKKDEGK